MGKQVHSYDERLAKLDSVIEQVSTIERIYKDALRVEKRVIKNGGIVASLRAEIEFMLAPVVEMINVIQYTTEGHSPMADLVQVSGSTKMVEMWPIDIGAEDCDRLATPSEPLYCDIDTGFHFVFPYDLGISDVFATDDIVDVYAAEDDDNNKKYKVASVTSTAITVSTTGGWTAPTVVNGTDERVRFKLIER